MAGKASTKGYNEGDMSFSLNDVVAVREPLLHSKGAELKIGSVVGIEGGKLRVDLQNGEGTRMVDASKCELASTALGSVRNLANPHEPIVTRMFRN
jgi:hypothetical protein